MLSYFDSYQRTLRRMESEARVCNAPPKRCRLARLGQPSTEDYQLAVDGAPSVLLRQAFRATAVDESLPFGLGLDSKLVFARILEVWSPGAGPRTWGIAEAARALGGGLKLFRFLRQRRPRFVVKRAYGAGSNQRFDKTNEIDPHSVRAPVDPANEEYVVQERLSVTSEYRVHTVGNIILCGGTDHRYETTDDTVFFPVVEGHVSAVLSAIPVGLRSHLVVGWDVSVDESGTPSIIEANVTGLHQRYRPGFQTSGFFGDAKTGPRMLAAVLQALGAELEPSLPPGLGVTLHHSMLMGYADYRAAVAGTDARSAKRL